MFYIWSEQEWMADTATISSNAIFYVSRRMFLYKVFHPVTNSCHHEWHTLQTCHGVPQLYTNRTDTAMINSILEQFCDIMACVPYSWLYGKHFLTVERQATKKFNINGCVTKDNWIFSVLMCKSFFVFEAKLSLYLIIPEMLSIRS